MEQHVVSVDESVLSGLRALHCESLPIVHALPAALDRARPRRELPDHDDRGVCTWRCRLPCSREWDAGRDRDAKAAVAPRSRCRFDLHGLDNSTRAAPSKHRIGTAAAGAGGRFS